MAPLGKALKYARCGHPKAAVSDVERIKRENQDSTLFYVMLRLNNIPTRTNAPDGRNIDNLERCDVMRLKYSKCGPKGKLWEPW